MKASFISTLTNIFLSLLLPCVLSQVAQPTASVKAFAGQGSAAASSTALIATHPLGAADFARTAAALDRSLVPNVVGQIRPDRQQSFSIKGQGFADFSIMPVRYESTSADSQEPTTRCGVYVVSAEGGATFVRTLGYDNREAEVCGGLLGVGFLPKAFAPPRIILLYNGGSFNSPGKDPVILAWDAKAHRYVSDDEVVRRLGDATTIPAIKAKLKGLER